MKRTSRLWQSLFAPKQYLQLPDSLLPTWMDVLRDAGLNVKERDRNEMLRRPEVEAIVAELGLKLNASELSGPSADVFLLDSKQSVSIGAGLNVHLGITLLWAGFSTHPPSNEMRETHELILRTLLANGAVPFP